MCVYILNPVSYFKNVLGNEQNGFSHFSNYPTEIWFLIFFFFETT